MFKQGERVEISTKNQVFKGVFIKEGKDYLVVKLGSGYNVGVAKRNIKHKKSLGKPKPAQQKSAKLDFAGSTNQDLLKSKISEGSQQAKLAGTPKSKRDFDCSSGTKEEVKKEQQDPKLPSISILHTGGTIASKVDYSTGAVIAQFTESDILRLFPEIKELANIKSRLVRNMQSEMIRFAHYNILAKAVKEEAEKGADGIIVTQGTDTLHQTSAALAFALENLGIPVLVVGSQRSSDRGSTDSALNLISAAHFIVNSDFAGVGLCMHENPDDDTCWVLPACKTRKMHTSRRDAFRPINTLPIARINIKKKEIEFIAEIDKRDNKKKINLKLFNEKLKVGLIKPHIQMFESELHAYKAFDGLVVELLGIGHIPSMKVDEFTKENEKILKTLVHLAKKMPVVVAPQTIYGRINMNVYTPGKQLLEAGVIGNYTDMTPETAFIKLAWLLSNYKKKEEIKELFEKNLRGEISDRSEKEFFLI